MIDETFSLNIEALRVSTKKQTLGRVLNLIETLPISRAKEVIQESFERCEDKEFAIERTLEPVNPKYSCL